MPIVDIQRRLHEAGRIRIGQQLPTSGGKTRPAKLDALRFTSSSEEAIRTIARIYGGDPHPWEKGPTAKQWEVFTAADHVRVLVPPEAMGFSQHYELWSGGGCQRRCDGFNQVPSGETCVCDPDERECKPHTRLSVMLTEMPSSGLWRLDTQGFHAAAELSGGFELARLIASASGRSVLGASLRLEQREVKRPGQGTRKFAVPVLDFDVDPRALAGEAAAPRLAAPGVTPVPALAAPSLADQLQAVDNPQEKPRRANAAEPIRPTGVRPRPARAMPPDEDPGAPTDQNPGGPGTTIVDAVPVKPAQPAGDPKTPSSDPQTPSFLKGDDPAPAGERKWAGGDECPFCWEAQLLSKAEKVARYGRFEGVVRCNGVDADGNPVRHQIPSEQEVA